MNLELGLSSILGDRAALRRTVVRVAVAAALVGGVAAVSAAPKPSTTLASVSADGTGSSNVNNFFPNLSSNGRFVVWDSQSSDLVTNDTNGTTYDSFVRDLAKLTTRAASLNAAGTGTSDGSSFESSVTPSGRFVAFGSDGTDLLPGVTKTSQKEDVYLRDTKLGRTVLVSQNLAGSGWCNGSCETTAISDNGRWVAFASSATDLVSTSTSGGLNVYVRDVKKGVTTLVSVNAAGSAGGNGDSNQPTISLNGRYVAFTSTATDLVAGGTTQRAVYVRDLVLKRTVLVSEDVTVGSPNPATVSANGRYVAWQSATNDVYVRDLKESSTVLASPLATGGPSGHSSGPRLSANGRYVAFSSNSPDMLVKSAGAKALVAGPYDVYLRDLVAQTTTLVSVNAAGTGGGDANSYYPTISKDGRVIAFESQATNLTTDAIRSTPNIFVRRVR